MYFKRDPHAKATGRSKNRGRKVLSLSALSFCALFLTFMCVFSNSCICYAVAYDGTVVGQVSSRAELDAAIAEADSMAEAILGTENPVSSELTVSALVGTQAESAEELAGKLVESIEGIEWRWVVTVDGRTAGAVESPEELNDILGSILDRYTNDATVSAYIKEDVVSSRALCSAEVRADAQALSRLLDPDNAESEFRLTVVTLETSQTTETIPYENEVIYDAEGYSDESSVLREGQDGEMTYALVSEFENGAPVSTEVISSFVSVAPVSKLVIEGVLPGSRTDSRGYYIWPTVGIVTSEFGGRETDVGSTNHSGMDIGNNVGTDVWAADGGEVIYAGNTYAAYGIMVKILHDNGEVTCYAHLSKVLVEVGDRVAQGDIIAKMGMTGYVSGPHLHFEIRPDGENPVNPRRYIDGSPELG